MADNLGVAGGLIGQMSGSDTTRQKVGLVPAYKKRSAIPNYDKSQLLLSDVKADPVPENTSILDRVKFVNGLIGGAAQLATPLPLLKKGISNLSENLDPYSYDSRDESGSKISWASRAVGALFGKKEQSRIETERLAKEGVNSFGQKSDEPKTRIDLLNLWAGKPQAYNTLEESKYRPSIGDEPNLKYLSSKSIEDDIVNNMFNMVDDTGKKVFEKGIKKREDLENLITKVAYTAKGKGGTVVRVPSLGDATLGVGSDEKGHYLSYSDKWDIDPTSGSYSSGNSGKLSGMANLMTKVGLVTPPRVYGRIYFDPKTGKRL